jgi:hypothetical protein
MCSCPWGFMFCPVLEHIILCACILPVRIYPCWDISQNTYNVFCSMFSRGVSPLLLIIKRWREFHLSTYPHRFKIATVEYEHIVMCSRTRVEYEHIIIYSEYIMSTCSKACDPENINCHICLHVIQNTCGICTLNYVFHPVTDESEPCGF